jgi:hypothetical protein
MEQESALTASPSPADGALHARAVAVPGRNCGYGQVMTKLADGLYHQRRAADLLEGRLL